MSSKIKVTAPKAVTQFQSSDGATHESKAEAIAHDGQIQIATKAQAVAEHFGIDWNDAPGASIVMKLTTASGSKAVHELAATLTAYAPYFGGAKAKTTAPKTAVTKAAAIPAKAAALPAPTGGEMTLEAAKKLHKAYCSKPGRKPVDYAVAKAMVEAAQQAAADEKAAAKAAKAASKPAAAPKAVKAPKVPSAPKAGDTGPMSLEEAEAMVEKYTGKKGRKPANFEKAQRIVASAEGKSAPTPAKAPSEKAPVTSVTPPPTAGHRPPPPPPQSPE